jgi:hypothetical protein
MIFEIKKSQVYPRESNGSSEDDTDDNSDLWVARSDDAGRRLGVSVRGKSKRR